MQIDTDIIIIGAGPAGLATVFQCGMHGLKSVVVDSLPHVGGQCVALYPDKPIYDIPGLNEVSGQGLTNRLKEQAEKFSPQFLLGQEVISFSEENLNACENPNCKDFSCCKRMLIETSENSKIFGKAIIIAAGAGAFSPRKINLQEAQYYEGKSLFYSLKNIHDLQNKKVLIAGGGDSALDWAIHLSDIAEKIFLVHRRDKFKAHEDSVKKLHNFTKVGKIELLTFYTLKEIVGNSEAGEITSVKLTSFSKKDIEVEIDVCLPFFGLSSNLGPIAKWNLSNKDSNIVQDKKDSTIPINTNSCETNYKGIFAVGDVAFYPNRQKLIVHGFSEAAKAAFHAREFIFPNKKFHFEHSSTSGIPKLS